MGSPPIVGDHATTEWVLMAVMTALAGIAAWIAWWLYGRGINPAPVKLSLVLQGDRFLKQRVSLPGKGVAVEANEAQRGPLLELERNHNSPRRLLGEGVDIRERFFSWMRLNFLSVERKNDRCVQTEGRRPLLLRSAKQLGPAQVVASGPRVLMWPSI